LNITASNFNGLSVQSGSSVTISGLVNIQQSGGGDADGVGGFGVKASGTGTVLKIEGADGSTILGRRYGINVYTNAAAELDNLSLTATDGKGVGLIVRDKSSLIGKDLSIKTTGREGSHGLYVGNQSTATITNLLVDSTGTGATGVGVQNATLTLAASDGKTNKVGVAGDNSCWYVCQGSWKPDDVQH